MGQALTKTYKQLTQKQKAKISDYMYWETHSFWQAPQESTKKIEDTGSIDQDDTFFYIAGYTSGGAPYGVTWEEMGLEPFESLE